MKVYKHDYEYIKNFIESKKCLILTPKEEYKNTHQKLELQCYCGNKFNASFKTFAHNKPPKQQCNECGLKNIISKRTLPLKKLQTEIDEKFNNEFEIVGDFKNRRTHTKFKHKICGYEWLTTPENFIRSKGCPKCNKVRKDITTKSFKKEVFKLTKGEYELIGEYTKAINKTLFKHNVCNRIYESTPHDFMSGCRCSICRKENRFGNLKKDTSSFAQETRKKYGNEYTIVGEYLGARTKTEVRHNKCGNVFKITPDNLLRGKGCPHCFESKGEKRIAKFLKKNNIDYVPQYKIDECKNIKPLPFDFGIFKDKKLILLVEYDGKQHFEIVPGWGGEKMFAELTKRDNIKNQYCKKNNIKLIRISYLDYDNIEKILSNYA